MGRVMTMYRVFVDSLMNPKALLDHRNKGGWFTFGYAMILIFLMSISTIVYLAGFPWANPVTEAATGCALADQVVVCEPSATLRVRSMYGVSVYFFNADEAIPSTIDTQSIVVQGGSIRVQNGTTNDIEVPFAVMGATSFDAVFAQLYAGLRISVFLFGLFQNGFFFLLIVLISTMSVLRLRQFIPYKKLFRLVLFASTTIAVLITFYNLLPVPEWVMFLVLILGIRPHFILQRELTLQTMLHLQEMAQSASGEQPASEPIAPEESVEDPAEDDPSEDSE